MSIILMVLLTIFIVSFIISSIVILVAWNIHVSQVKEFCPSYSKGSYKDFLIQVNKHNFRQGDPFLSSLFDDDSNSEIHASIIKFNDVGMILNPIDFLKVSLWVFNMKQKRENNKRLKDFNWNTHE